MFSDNLPKINQPAVKPLLLAVGGILIVCQLTAMVLLTGNQVEKAQLRDASQSNASAAWAGCVESSRGVALRDCDRASSFVSADSTVVPSNPGLRGVNLVTSSNR